MDLLFTKEEIRDLSIGTNTLRIGEEAILEIILRETKGGKIYLF